MLPPYAIDGLRGIVPIGRTAESNARMVVFQVAIKFLERGAGISRGVVREVLNHRLCVAHPNIVQFREIFLTEVGPPLEQHWFSAPFCL